MILVVVVLAVVVVGGGLFLLLQGDDEASEEEQAYIDAMTEAALAEQDEDEDSLMTLSEDQARCLATAAVDAVGVDRLEEVATPEEIRENPGDDLSDRGIELSEEQATAVYDDTNGCLDYREVFMTGFEEGRGFPPDVVDCVNEALTDELLRNVMIAEFTEDENLIEAADQELETAVEHCDPDS